MWLKSLAKQISSKGKIISLGVFSEFSKIYLETFDIFDLVSQTIFRHITYHFCSSITHVNFFTTSPFAQRNTNDTYSTFKYKRTLVFKFFVLKYDVT
jgi:hypothetical protein